jgi:hypothetical protein
MRFDMRPRGPRYTRNQKVFVEVDVVKVGNFCKGLEAFAFFETVVSTGTSATVRLATVKLATVTLATDARATTALAGRRSRRRIFSFLIT